MGIFHIIIITIFFYLGYNFPIQIAWLLLFILPFLYPTYIAIYPASNIPLTIDRLGFILSLGIFFRNFFLFKNIFKKITTIKYIFLFYLLLIITSFRDSGFQTILTSTIPNIITPLIIIFITIRTSKDINRLFRLLILQGVLFSILILSEYLGVRPFNAYLLNPHISADVLGDRTPEIRSGYLRAQGIDGNSVQTAYRLIMYFPLAIWWYLKGSKISLSVIPVILVLIAIILLQSRATLLVVFITSIFLVLYMTKSKNIKNRVKNKMINGLIYGGIFSVITIVLIFPEIFNILNESFVKNILLSSNNLDSEVIRGRDLYFLNAMNKIIESPIWGNGSPSFSYNLIDYNDVPSFVMYLLCGGIILTTAYFLMLYSMVKIYYHIIKYSLYSQSLKSLSIFIFFAMINGFFVTFFNWQEAHFLTLFLIFYSILSLNYWENKYALSIQSPKNNHNL